MSDAEQLLMFHEIMDLKEKVECGLEPGTAIMVSAVIILVVHLMAWIWYRRQPWCATETLALAYALSMGLGIGLAVSALVTQYNMGEYELMCEAYRALYGPLPWEVA